MKNSTLICLALLAALFISCQNSGKTTSTADSLSEEKNAGVQERQCYMAVDGKDTAWLNIQTVKSGKVEGDMLIKYDGKPNNDGKLKGEFKGDTLFADYTFTTGDKKEENRNPLAFLREGNKLTLGVGVIETYLGRSYLSKTEPIDFAKGRFKFNSTDCK